ncbi:hypothetical protein OAE26_00110 [Synechococcus sp. AH-551-E05]|nr:hypothetical protein [Synechococcus sp. AH-551-E05]MDB4650970.1 hypothetical protein [Synechococcus sp. AH-551-E05]
MSTYLLHANKCGGISLIHCLRQLNVLYTVVDDLLLTQESLTRLKEDPKSFGVITAHIWQLPRPTNKEELRIYLGLLNHLYTGLDLVMPVRHPANIIQSFMHSHKTRFNRYYLEYLKNKRQYISKKSAEHKK